jgi:hypothetical protein
MLYTLSLDILYSVVEHRERTHLLVPSLETVEVLAKLPIPTNFPHLTKPLLQIGYNEGAGQKIVPAAHRNYRFFKTLHFNAQCLQDFRGYTQYQFQT